MTQPQQGTRPAVDVPGATWPRDGVVEQVVRWAATGALIDAETAVAIAEERTSSPDVWRLVLAAGRAPAADVLDVLLDAVKTERLRLAAAPLPAGAPVRMQLRAQAAIDELGALAAYLETQRTSVRLCCHS